jgi:AcrR family transcriptional regulator
MRASSRQQEVAEAARRAIIKRGLDATLRDIAREGGFTTGLLSHHFPDKRAVIAAAFAAASNDFIEMARARFAGARDAPALLAELLDVALSRAPDRQAEWRLWAEMWAYAGRDPEFAATVERTDMLWVRELEAALARLIDDGALDADLDASVQATTLARLIDGLGLRAWLSGDWEGARAALVAHLRQLGLPARQASRLAARAVVERRRERAGG